MTVDGRVETQPCDKKFWTTFRWTWRRISIHLADRTRTLFSAKAVIVVQLLLSRLEGYLVQALP
eukprot:1089248-Lingulodinium_polyedra.AAC.1